MRHASFRLYEYFYLHRLPYQKRLARVGHCFTIHLRLYTPRSTLHSLSFIGRARSCQLQGASSQTYVKLQNVKYAALRSSTDAFAILQKNDLDCSIRAYCNTRPHDSYFQAKVICSQTAGTPCPDSVPAADGGHP